GCGANDGDDRIVKLTGPLQRAFRWLAVLFLSVAQCEYRRFVAVAPITELTAGISRIDAAPKSVEQLFIGDDIRIEGDFDSFIIAGSACRYLRVSRVRCIPADIARDGRENARNIIKIGFHAPEAAAGENGSYLGVSCIT